jgi:hypothetical protein
MLYVIIAFGQFLTRNLYPLHHCRQALEMISLPWVIRYFSRQCKVPLAQFRKKKAYYNIFDLVTQTWLKSSEYLITPRSYGATIIAAANRIFCAGGSQSDPPNNAAELSDVDIYDVTNNSWSTTKPSAGGIDIAGAVAGNKVLFAGGLREDPVKLAKTSAIDDLYDFSTNTWSVVASLNECRANILAVTANGKVYFAGGSAGINAIDEFLVATDVVDIYNIATDTWSLPSLDKPKTKMSGIDEGNKVFWAGGLGPWEVWEADVDIEISTPKLLPGSACLRRIIGSW